ncbi:hypothetical protein P0136_09415 [Lentisphaerota bacterium ZTH]|nr:hypothetical protein JYG24_13070 [Lentisphaerota bacterium]WET05582.1 hypothetical protein P0136_09415 [Lentisphaerota bacterium ZTH]
MLSNSVMALVECAQCGELVEPGTCCLVEENEVRFRKMYAECIMQYIKTTHLDFIDSCESGIMNLDTFYQLYHSPEIRVGSDDSREVTVLTEAEDMLRIRRMSAAAGGLLPYQSIREDIQETASGMRCQGFGFNADEIELEQVPVCQKCMSGSLDFRLRSKRAVTPMNIQLAMKFDQIVGGSDIVVILSERGERYSALNFLIDYLKLYSNRSLLLGLPTFDHEDDYTRPEFSCVREILRDKFIEYCESGSGSYDYHDLVSVITAYGLPVMNVNKYFSRNWVQRNRLNVADLLVLVEGRCRNVACFGTESPLCELVHFNGEEYNGVVDNYYESLKAACIEFHEQVPTKIEAKTSAKNRLLKSFATRFEHSAENQNEIIQKICSYYSAVNHGSGAGPKVPLIVTVSSFYGFQVQGQTSHQLIQDALKQRLRDMDLSGVKVTTIYAVSNKPPARIFSKEKNTDLADIGLDFVMYFSRL